MSKFVSDNFTSLFAETASNVGEALFVSIFFPLYPDLLEEIVAVEDAVERGYNLPECPTRVVATSDEEDFVDVPGEVSEKVRIGAESEGFTSLDALRKANLPLVSVSDPEAVVDACGSATSIYHIIRYHLPMFYVNTH